MPYSKKLAFLAVHLVHQTIPKKIVDYITPSVGGMGAFRDFVIETLNREKKFQNCFRKIN